jgi:drug/metabolite transporter (DMT)-like permease
VSRRLVWSLYGVIILIWSSTWVGIKFGLEGTPPLFGAGLRFVLSGVLLLAIARIRRRPLRTDRVLAAILATLPFALTYGLIYWAEQYVPSGLTAVLFGVMPLYVAVLAAFLLKDEAVGPRLFAGLGVALVGLVVAFGESLDLGTGEYALLGAIAVLVSPIASAIGNVAIRRRGSGLDPVVVNGWAMLAGGLILLAVSLPTEAWSDAVWDATAIGAILYLAIFGTAISFVVLTVLIGELGALPMSYLPLMLPFGALLFGWTLYDEALTAPSVAGAVLVAAGLVLAQRRARRPVPASADAVVPAPPEPLRAQAAPRARSRG